MKNVLKLLVLSTVLSGLVACSSAKKEEESLLADLDKTEVSSEAAVEPATTIDDSSSIIDSTETNASSLIEDNSSSLGTGSSGLGH